MIRRPPRSTLDRSSAASDVYKRQVLQGGGALVVGAVENAEKMALLRSTGNFVEILPNPARKVDLQALLELLAPVSYTHLTLPTSDLV